MNLLFLTSSTVVRGCLSVSQLRRDFAHLDSCENQPDQVEMMSMTYLLGSVLLARAATVKLGTSRLITTTERKRNSFGPCVRQLILKYQSTLAQGG